MVQREKACSILPYSLTDELNRRNLVGIPLEDSPERAIYLVQNNHHGHCEAHRYLFEQLRYYSRNRKGGIPMELFRLHYF